ncbi:hypothetical protein OMO38_10200 [Chryseobacterium sp. 09-1422]|uniref:Uncharacterized protein n=1 Tax=Chryseobacterium kimseyorum TaxID=2984028 RepID=A0ABT3HYL4_9FLAO|nr:hypothetical protein [Chryseobacterium kimseyorum]
MIVEIQEADWTASKDRFTFIFNKPDEERYLIQVYRNHIEDKSSVYIPFISIRDYGDKILIGTEEPFTGYVVLK